MHKYFYKKRLLKLADFLDKLPKSKFFFGNFIAQYGKPPLEALEMGEYRCGTTACAIGWSPAVFPKLVRWIKDEESGKIVDIRTIRGQRNFMVGVELFGITERQSEFLFDPITSGLGSYATAKTVANHIRKFVKKEM